MPLDLPFRTAKQLAAAVRKKKIGCLELLDLYLKRVEAYNPELNAIIAMDVEGRAQAGQGGRQGGQEGRQARSAAWRADDLQGILRHRGLPHDLGRSRFKDHKATKNALAVQRMIDAGVTVFGKTNVPLNLADWQSYNEVYGSTNNPWDLGRTPGGSSGGSAAALAAGLTGIDAGSDIGASIRNPRALLRRVGPQADLGRGQPARPCAER